MHHYCQIAESNYDYIFTITSDFYTTFLCFYELISILLLPLKELYNISHEAALMVMNFFNFVCLGKSASLLCFWRKSSLNIKSLFDSYFSSVYEICHPIFSWPEKFFENSTNSLIGVTCISLFLLLFLLLKFFLWLLTV